MDTQQQTFWQRYGLFFKSMVVGFLMLVLLIPASFIQDLVRERQERQTEVIAEVSSKWASAQKIASLRRLIFARSTCVRPMRRSWCLLRISSWR